MALAIAAGHAHAAVHRLPHIAIIDSGDELAIDCENCPPHQIPASNGAMLSAMARSLPCTVERLGPVADDMTALADVLARAAHADVIVTSGGASVGDHDLVRPALEAWGADIDFWRIAIKPGKPLLVATRGKGEANGGGAKGSGPKGSGRHQIVLGLPGNPVSSHVAAYLFMLPLMRALLGAAQPLPRKVRARLTTPLPPGGSRREFLRAVWDGADVAVQSRQDSAGLATLAASNALIEHPAGSPAREAGADVFAYLIENGGTA
jgi:molybdopterin molybdotransferase